MGCRQHLASLYIKSQGCTMTCLLFPGCLHGFRGVRVQPQALCQAGDQGTAQLPRSCTRHPTAPRPAITRAILVFPVKCQLVGPNMARPEPKMISANSQGNVQGQHSRIVNAAQACRLFSRIRRAGTTSATAAIEMTAAFSYIIQMKRLRGGSVSGCRGLTDSASLILARHLSKMVLSSVKSMP